MATKIGAIGRSGSELDSSSRSQECPCVYTVKLLRTVEHYPIMAYHSHYNSDTGFKLCCGIPLVPLNPAGSESSFDPVEEAIELFRPNSLFKNFEFRGPGDKLLVYLIIFINSCLRRKWREGAEGSVRGGTG